MDFWIGEPENWIDGYVDCWVTGRRRLGRSNGGRSVRLVPRVRSNSNWACVHGPTAWVDCPFSWHKIFQPENLFPFFCLNPCACVCLRGFHLCGSSRLCGLFASTKFSTKFSTKCEEALLFGNFLPFWLGWWRRGCRGRFRLHHPHLLLIFLK